MSLTRRFLMNASGAFILLVLVGCQATETAPVSFSYVVEAARGLPEGMDSILIQPAKLGPSTDAKWSDLSSRLIQSLVNESRTSFGTNVTISDRSDTQVTFDEADLAAAGLSTKKTRNGGQLLAADGAILSNINVKVEKHYGSERTLSGLSLAGVRGRGWRAGGVDIETSEVETVTRTLTVQTEFKLIDTADNQVWEHSNPRTFTATNRTKVSPIFGSSQTEAALTPQDEIIASLVNRGAREFISRLMPCRIDVDTEVLSSTNQSCIEGVRMLRGEMFDEAVGMFKHAISMNSDDHRAAYGAGVACEATGQYDSALRYYKRACAGANSSKYLEARDRLKAYGDRIRQE